MPYLVDGHNLIPKIPGLSLSTIDDELQLLRLLQEFCRLRRKDAEVFFDQAPPLQPGLQKQGRVKAHFVPQGQSADTAIRVWLNHLGKDAHNWIVISSDQAVQSSARIYHAKIMPSESFARELVAALDSRPGPSQPAQAEMGAEELQDWLKLFRKKPPEE